MEPEGSLPHSQTSATRPYPGPLETFYRKYLLKSVGQIKFSSKSEERIDTLHGCLKCICINLCVCVTCTRNTAEGGRPKEQLEF